jgi:protein pelota
MKLLRREIESSGLGQVTVMLEEAEDFWHLYNLVTVGDRVRTSTMRKVKKESSTGSVAIKDKVKMNLTIQIDSVDFDARESSLRLSGRNVEENEFVKMGAFHTIQVELHRQFTLQKPYWDEIAQERLQEATDVAKRAEVAALMIEEGMANLFLLTDSMTVLRLRVETPIPRKRIGSSTQHDSSLQKFFATVLEGTLRNVEFAVVKCLVIAGPGFVKDQFHKFVMQQALLEDNRKLLENKDKLLLATASSVHKHSLKEVLSDKRVLEQMADTKAAREVLALSNFFIMLSGEPDRATYGLKTVQKANSQTAIETLLISDDLFRAKDVRTRQLYVDLVKSVRDNGGDVKIFSSMHVSGHQLAELTGVAAILRFPIPGLDDDEDKDGDDDDDDDDDEKEDKNDSDQDDDDDDDDLPLNPNVKQARDSSSSS